MKVLCIETKNQTQIPQQLVARYADTIDKFVMPPELEKLKDVDAVIINADSIQGTRNWIRKVKEAKPECAVILAFSDIDSGQTFPSSNSRKPHLHTIGADYVVPLNNRNSELSDALKAIRNQWNKHHPEGQNSLSSTDYIFADKAEQLCLRPVSLPHEIRMDGQQYYGRGDGFSSPSTFPSPSTDHATRLQRLKHMGHYHHITNNGTNILGFIDEDGALRIAKDTKENIHALHMAGYKKSEGIPMPFTSNGGCIADPDLNERLEFIIKDRPILSAEAERLAGKVAQEKGIKEIDYSNFFRVDGTVYRESQDLAVVEKNTITDTVTHSPDHHPRNAYLSPNPDRIHHVGEWCVENGIIGFIDPKGHCYIGADTHENRTRLSEANYTPGQFEVPYAHQKGEIGLPITYEHLIPASKEPFVNEALRQHYFQATGRAKSMEQQPTLNH